MAHRAPGWMTSPPDAVTLSRAEGRSATRKYGNENRSPGPDPRSWRPIPDPPACVCQPRPSPAALTSKLSPRTVAQNLLARDTSSAGNSTKATGEVGGPGEASGTEASGSYQSRSASARSPYVSSIIRQASPRASVARSRPRSCNQCKGAMLCDSGQAGPAGQGAGEGGAPGRARHASLQSRASLLRCALLVAGSFEVPRARIGASPTAPRDAGGRFRAMPTQ